MHLKVKSWQRGKGSRRAAGKANPKLAEPPRREHRQRASLILVAALDVRTASHVVTEPELASRDELGELLQRSGRLELAATIEAQVENMPARGLELGIFERL